MIFAMLCLIPRCVTAPTYSLLVQILNLKKPDAWERCCASVLIRARHRKWPSSCYRECRGGEIMSNNAFEDYRNFPGITEAWELERTGLVVIREELYKLELW